MILQKKKYLKQRQADYDDASEESNDTMRRRRRKSLRPQTSFDTSSESLHEVKVL